MTYQYDFKARSVHVVDGDTIDFEVDLGFHLTKQIRVRLLDVDTAEIYGVHKESDEYQLGMDQKQFVEEWVNTGDGEWPLTVRTFNEKGKYGRWLAYVWKGDQRLDKTLIRKWPEVESDA